MPDAWLSQSVSSAFLEAFRRCNPIDERETSEHFMAFPAVVCAAFSAEVGLKTLLSRQGVSSKSHDLRALLLKLPAEQQYAIFEATGLAIEEFSAQLSHSRLAFVEWRYVHEENQEMSVNLGFLGKFASAVEAIALQAKRVA